MGIDGIGNGKKPGAGLPVAEKPGVERPTETAAPFAVRDGVVDRAAPATSISATHPLARLRAGEIDARTYVELKVDEATAHLRGLRGADLETIRSELRHRMSSDPDLADLVKQATGGASVDPPEE